MDKPFFMPTSYFSIPLGLGATAIAWFHAGEILSYGERVGNILGITATLIWVTFIAIYSYKLVARFELVKEEWKSLFRFSFISLIPITTMIIGDLFYHWHFILLGETLVWTGVVGQLGYAILKIGSLWKGNNFTTESAQPPFYLLAIASNFTSASSIALLGYTDIAYLFLGAGLIYWLTFEPILLQRLRILPIPADVKPSLGIALAPPFVCSAAYLSINGGEIDLLVKLLWGYGFLQFLFLLRIFSWVIKEGLSIGLWSFSFGLASMANSAVEFYTDNILKGLAIFAFIFANIIISLLILNTLIKLVQGKFWQK
ncbi:dicarboxylate transporter/tellurite-resistance protein TehA [Rodentibacter caecimuris]|uniref:Dicarboxylate transporter/tellurite-resistance protein TehA n=1 Tax=Rodentibacter caecimuris TaxID=1796644 RepID=A0ABX3KZL2_9PAST|nr:dicarboxylate transporter/tellurite-resistance protein TehA [Rodentibacter heylii]